MKRIHHKGGTLYGDLTWRIHSRMLSAVGPDWDRSSKDGGEGGLGVAVFPLL